jgi:hypothetical protein
LIGPLFAIPLRGATAGVRERILLTAPEVVTIERISERMALMESGSTNLSIAKVSSKPSTRTDVAELCSIQLL